MAKIISVNVEHPRYGETEVNVERVIAVIPEKRRVLFEDVYWDLDDKNFKKLYQAWKGEAVSIEPKQCLYSGGRLRRHVRGKNISLDQGFLADET